MQSAHVVRRLTGRADWAAIEQLYDALLALTGSPVVAINRAVAIAETRGAAAGLAALDALRTIRGCRLPALLGGARALRAHGESPAADAAYDARSVWKATAVRRFLQGRRSGINA